MNKDSNQQITIQTLQRLPYYLEYLKELRKGNVELVSSTSIATILKLNDVQVRKDISAICTTKGKPKTGFNVNDLINNIEDYLGYNNYMDAVLIGVGNTGANILSTKSFEKHGLNIVAAFDISENLVGTVVSDVGVFHIEKLKNLCQRMHIHIGIIAVPEKVAQDVCDVLISGGIEAIWNFTLTKLNVPDNIFVQNENPSASLLVLSQRLRSSLRDRN